MFKLQKHKKQLTSPTKSAETFDFSFSNFQALQVPNGWDKLYVSIISVETGKTIAKSNKATVRNGTCQWTETLSQSLWIAPDDSSKELDEYLFKFVISMGSARSGILGESIVNMSRYKSSRASELVTLPLKKCSYGTVLQVTINCLTTNLRDEESSKHSNSQEEVQVEEHLNDGDESNGTEESLAMSLRSQSSQELSSNSHPENLGSTETSYAASSPSFASAEGSIRRVSIAQSKERNGSRYSAGGRQVAVSSRTNLSDDIHPANDPFISNHSSFNSRITHSEDNFLNYEEEYEQISSPHIATSLANAGSSRSLLETAEDTIEELRDEAKMWERNSRKLMLDLDILREKFSSQSKKQVNVKVELSEAYAERDAMKKEVEKLKFLLEESDVKRKSTKCSNIQLVGVTHIQKELENEIKFQKEENAYLALQLKKSQESNVEFLSVLQELEETIERQKVEIQNLSELQVRYNNLEGSIQGKLEDNNISLLHLHELEESEIKLLVKVQVLQKALLAKSNEVEKERGSYQKSLLAVEQEYSRKLSVADEEVVNLNAKLAETISEIQEGKMGHTNGDSADMLTEIQELLEKVQDLERDCRELTDENLELLCKIQDLDKVVQKYQLAEAETSDLFPEFLKQIEMVFHQIKKPWYNILFELNDECESHYRNLMNMKGTDTMASKAWADSVCNYFMDLNKLLEARIIKCEEVLKTGEFEMNKRDRTIAQAKSQMENFSLKVEELECSNVELEANIANLEKDLAEKKSEVERLEADLLLKEEQINLFRQGQIELKAQTSTMQKERDQMQENMEIALKENNITSKCLDDLRKYVMVLNSNLESNVSANKSLQKKSSELETEKRKLELHLFEVEEENVQLLERISGLEAQMENAEKEKESNQLALENSKNVVVSLQDDIKRLTVDMETEKIVFKDKLLDLENRLSEAQEECDYLKIAYQKSQASGDNLSEKYNTLQKLNVELGKQKGELHEQLKSLVNDHQDDIRRLTTELESEQVVFQQKLQETENRLSMVQEECEKEKMANQKSQASVESITENYCSLQKLNAELGKEKQELHENFKSVANGLQDEIIRITTEMETEKVIFQEKLRETENQLSTVQEECEHQKIAKQKSQASVESLAKNCSSLQKLNAELVKQKEELHENFKFVANGLQDEIRKLTIELDTEKVTFQEKLQETETRLSEVQEECEHQKITNQKLQAYSDSLTKNYNSLQRLNEELRAQNLELHEHCTQLETKVRETQRSLSDCAKRIKCLEENLSSALEEFALKEKVLTSELNVLLQENREQREKLMQEESLLNQMYLEKTAEVDNLQREVEHLISHISTTNDERDRISLEAVNELSNLHSDKEKLELALQEASFRSKLTEDELDNVRAEYEMKVQGLMVELAASKQRHADHEKVLKSLASYRSTREKLKTSVNDLELKLTISEYERQQLVEETTNLKAQLQKIARSQNDVFSLKSILDDSKVEREKLAALLHSVSVENEILKAENDSYAERISSLQDAMSEFEECKHKRVVLEERLLQVERDLTAKEASHAEESELRNELSRMDRATKQYKLKIQQFEDDNNELLKRTESLEEDLKLMEEEKNNRMKSDPKKGDKEYDFHAGSPHVAGMDYVEKALRLEKELAEALEANDRYKIQLQSIFSDGIQSHSAAPRKSTSGGEMIARTKSSLETELIDLRDRYFQMSLRYAEVEAQREDLVMKLKTSNNGKRWFL